MRAGLPLLVRRSLREHTFSSSITIASVGLATGLVLAVFAIQEQSLRAFTAGPLGFDAVLGARGSQLQLVLNAVFHLETSPGNIPWALYEAIARDPQVERAIPYAVGDNYRGFRIVGTLGELFTERSNGSDFPLRIAAGGRLFDPQRREAVIGSSVAREAGLALGDTFHPHHGLFFDESARHAEEYVVAGVLEPSNTPADRVIWIPLEGIYRLAGHVLRGAGDAYEADPAAAIPDEHKEVSAVMLDLVAPQAGFFLDQTINKQGKVATLAWPIGRVMGDLFDKLGWAIRVLGLVAYLVVLVAAGSIVASIVNTMQERRRDFAVLRALGARRRTVSAAIVGEAASIGVLGALLGFVVYAGIFALARAIVRSQTGVVLDPWIWHPVFGIAPAAVVLLAALAGTIPARLAYRTDVATHLVPPS
ncbi:MAG: ABC transporter permease [Myxococcota bacterium]|nr:ABC transporter permease [Myxococcota bacterium]